MSLCIENCVQKYKEIVLAPVATPISENREDPKLEEELLIQRSITQRETEENFSLSFFVEMNNALFCGEYLNSDYNVKIDDFELVIGQTDTEFSILIKDALGYLKYLKGIIESKINLSDEELLFSAMSTPKTTKWDNNFLRDFVNISIKLALIDHMLLTQKTDDITELIEIKEQISRNRSIETEDAKVVYDKLNSKCLYLLRKLCFVLDDTHKYALDFNIYDIDDFQVKDQYNHEFYDLFDCIYEKRKVQDRAYYYQEEFRQKKFSCKGFIVLAQYYRTCTKDISQVDNLINRYNRFYSINSQRNICQFDRYALESVRHYLYNCRFSLLLEKRNYSVPELKTEIDRIIDIQSQTRIQNYHPYYKALDFLSKKIHDNEGGAMMSRQDILQLIALFNQLLEQYKIAIDWCIHRRFYPFQLQAKDCITSNGLFIASSFATPLNVKKLNNLHREYRDVRQLLGMQSQYLQHKEELDVVQGKIKAFRKESFEYLGIFIAIITFLFGSLQLFGTDINLEKALINIISLGIVLCLFGINISIAFKEWLLRYKMFYFIGLIILAIFLLFAIPNILHEAFTKLSA